MIVVITTTITTGPRNEDPISPRADPLSATISASGTGALASNYEQIEKYREGEMEK